MHFCRTVIFLYKLYDSRENIHSWVYIFFPDYHTIPYLQVIANSLLNYFSLLFFNIRYVRTYDIKHMVVNEYCNMIREQIDT